MATDLHSNGSDLDYGLVMNETVNSTLLPAVPPGPPWSLAEKIVMGAWLCVSILCATIGNLMVIVVVIRHRGMQTRTNMFLVNLAIADFLVGTVMAPFALTTLIKEKWVFGDIMCSINGFLNSLCFITSIHTLMHISIHKYVSITYPFSRKLNNCKILAMIFGAWCWSFICAILTMFILSDVVYKPGTTQCGPRYPKNASAYLHHVIIQTTNIIIPLSIMIFAYARMYCEFRQHAIRLRNNTTLQSDQIIGQQIQVTKTLFIVLATFILCWLPYFVYTTYVSLVKDKSMIPGWANPAAYCFMYMNSGCNPIIYAWRSPSFREGYKEILCQQPSYVVSDALFLEMLMINNRRPSQASTADTIRDSDSPSIIRRLSAMLHTSFRATRFGSRRNSDDASSVGSSHHVQSVSCSSPHASHNLLRRATSKTAKGSSIIKKDGSLIITKNGKIVSIKPDADSLKREKSFHGFMDMKTGKDNGVSRSLTELSRIAREKIELAPLLRNSHLTSAGSSSDQSQPSSPETSLVTKNCTLNANSVVLKKLSTSEEIIKPQNSNLMHFSSESDRTRSLSDISSIELGKAGGSRSDPPGHTKVSDEVFEAAVSPVIITFNSEENVLNAMPLKPKLQQESKIAKSDLAIDKQPVVPSKQASKRNSAVSKSSDVVFHVPLLKCPSIERLDMPTSIPRCSSDVSNIKRLAARSPLYKRRWLSNKNVDQVTFSKS